MSAPVLSLAEARQRVHTSLATGAMVRADRPPDHERLLALLRTTTQVVPDQTGRYAVPGGTARLRPIQSHALYWAERMGGLIGPIGLGDGKTLIDLLLPVAMGARRPVVLIPSSLYETFHAEARKWRAHFKVSDDIRIVTYSQLSIEAGADLLAHMAPDLIICDEADALRNPDAARTRRFIRYCKEHPEVKVVALSATLTKSGLADYAHLAELALRLDSPLPLDRNVLLSWANCVDATVAPPSRSDKSTYGYMMPEGWQDLPPAEYRSVAGQQFRAHCRSAAGWVASGDAVLPIDLSFTVRRPDIPAEVEQAIRDLRASWCRPDGEELRSPLDVYRVEAQLSAGFYYLWDWPRGVVDKEWMKRRAAWHRAIRQILALKSPAWDSPLRIRHAVRRGEITDLETVNAYEAWQGVQDRPAPPVRAVWLSDFLVQDAVGWFCDQLEAGRRTLLWYAHQAVGDAIGETGIPVYGPGTEISTDVHSCAASIAAHGRGKNLQAWANNLVLSAPSAGPAFEQLVGRTHREGQTLPVHVAVYGHTNQARSVLRRARRDAQYAADTLGLAQRMLSGRWDDPSVFEPEREDLAVGDDDNEEDEG